MLDRSERHHGACRAAVRDLAAPLVTCEAVIAESCWLLRRLPGAADAVLQNLEDGIFQIPIQLSSMARAVRALMKKYASAPMDLADACLASLADLLDTGDILTLDGDFRAYRSKKTRRFNLLVPLG